MDIEFVLFLLAFISVCGFFSLFFLLKDDLYTMYRPVQNGAVMLGLKSFGLVLALKTLIVSKVKNLFKRGKS